MCQPSPGPCCAPHAREAAARALHRFQDAYPGSTVRLDPLTAARAHAAPTGR